MKRFIFCLVFVCLCVGTSLAQSPTVILKRAAKALGGEAALRSVRSWQASGSITRVADGAAGTFQSQAQQPNFYAGNFDLNGFEIAVGFNGKSGWMRDSKNGLRTLTGEAAKDFQAEAAWRNSRWLNYKQDKSKIVAAGQIKVNGKPANGVTLTTAKGVQIKFYFDAATNLLVREEIPQGETTKIFEYSDFRFVDDIQEPFTIISTVNTEKYEIKLNKITHNQPLDQAAFDFPKISNAPLPDINALLAEIRSNADKLDQIMENYSYKQTVIDREIDKNGNLMEKGSETTSLTFYKGYQIKRLVAKNGKPLSAKEQADEDKKVEKQIAEIERRIAEKESKKQQIQRNTKSGAPSNEGGNERITLSEALRGSLLVNPRRERFKERDAIVFDYEPNPNFKPQTRLEKLFALCSGAVWVDAEDKQVIRLEAFLTKDIGNFVGKAKRGASFALETERVNNEVWLPSRADVNLSLKILFVGININNLIKYGEYQKFSTEIKDAKVEPPR
jgi:hypothetical protein